MKKIKQLLSYLFVNFASYLLPIACFLLPTALSAQRNNFQTYTLAQHLPQSTIYCITQDKRGYLWLGMEGSGLCRFDGINFKTFDRKDGFNADVVRALIQDSKGRIWAGTSGEGVIMFDGRTFKNIGKKEGLHGSTVLSIMEDKDGAIWAGTDDGGVNRIRQVAADSFSVQVFDEEKGLSNKSVFDIHQDRQGHIWLATYQGISVLTLSGDSVKINLLLYPRDIPSESIASIAEDATGKLWFGTHEEGVFTIAPQKIKFSNTDFQLDLISRKVKVYNETNGFNAKRIWKIFLSSSNELWFASIEDGIVRQRNASITIDSMPSKYVFEHYTDKEGLPGKNIMSLFEDNTGNMWIGTNGDGLSKFMGDKFSHFTDKDGLISNKVEGIDQDSVGDLWLASSGGGLLNFKMEADQPVFKSYTTKDGLSGNATLSVSAGKAFNNHNIWTVVKDGGLSKFNGKKFTSFTAESDGLLDNSAYCVFVDKHGVVWCGSKRGISRWDGVKFIVIKLEETLNITEKDVNTVIQDKEENLWFASNGGLIKYTGDGNISSFDTAEGLTNLAVLSLAEGPQGNIWMGTRNGGIFMLDVHSKDKVKIKRIVNDASGLSSNSIRSLIFENEYTLIAATDKGFDKITLNDKYKVVDVRNYNASDGFLGVECNDNASFKDSKGNIWFGNVKGLTKYTPSLEKINQRPPLTHITSIKLFNKDVDWTTKSDSVSPWFNLPLGLTLKYNENHISFSVSAISMDNPQKLRYKYLLEGWEQEWSLPTAANERDYPVLPPGTYTFKVSSIGANGIWNSEPCTFTFTITPPWYRTYWFYGIVAILVIILIFSFIKRRERNLIIEKNILEEKVVERTAEVTKQKHELELQKEMIEEKNKDITDSINYAERIQQAILPQLEHIRSALPQSFIFFQPRDIVSGDFYWYNEASENGEPVYLLAAADCTGHGVPGAFMSMINSSLLNETVNEKKIIEPAQILNEVRRGIIQSLKQTVKTGGQKDGMDIGLISLRFKEDKIILEYAGANNSMYIVRQGSQSVLEEIAPDKMPVSISDNLRDFKNNVIELQPGDSFYIFTDGYADQFGGSKGKKFKYPPFKELLLSVQDLGMDEQKEILHSTMENWKGNLEQVDDILVIGVRL